jgi:tetratricopeptide (TPR) repeat protein
MDLVAIEFGGEIVSDNLQIVDDVDSSPEREGLESSKTRQLKFLVTVFMLIGNDGYADIIYQLFRENLDLLNLDLVDILQNRIISALSKSNRNEKEFLVACLVVFGGLVQDFPLGNKAVNIELSIECYFLALKIFTFNDSPESWSSIHNSIANAYSERIRGDRAENLEQAIEYYQAALKVRTIEDLPISWAETQNNLANAYYKRIREDRSENLERAIECHQAALKVRTKKDLPINWAITQSNLGIAYSERIRGDRSENLERATECYQAALTVQKKANFPVDWARTQHNLGNLYSRRINGDRSENLEQSIDCFFAALEVCTKTDFPVDWATTQHSLGNVYSERIRGNRADNLKQAIDYYHSALEIYTAKLFPSEWAMIQVNLARFSIEELQNYQFATEHLQSACEQLSIDNNDVGLLAKTMFELARCFHRTSCLEQAKIYFKDSIRLYQRLENFTQVAAVTSALGNLELQMGHIDDARIHLQTALEFYQAAGNLDRVASIQDLQQCLPEYRPEPAR